MPELLLELLSEEIPARMQARAAEDLKRLVCDGLKAEKLAFAKAEAFATPRRLALVVDGIPAKQPDVNEERRGPRADAPDNAIQGFKRSLPKGAKVELRDTDKGRFFFALVEKKGGKSEKVLKDILGSTLNRFPWPKSMKWADRDLPWIRPLHNVLALFHGKVVPFSIGLKSQNGKRVWGENRSNLYDREIPLTANNVTSGHPFLAPKNFKVKSFADYKAKLKKAKVILDPAERRKKIQADAEKLAKKSGLKLKRDPALLDEVAGLVEWPVVRTGRVDKAFMSLWTDVIITVMRHHQKYFALTNKGGQPEQFVVVLNSEPRDGGKAAVAGNERVLRARLADAKFFWDQDSKRPLEDHVPLLESRVFHTRLGDMREKVRRIQSVADLVSGYLPTANPSLVKRAAQLCKADLMTQMVGEFPELQGKMGGRYAAYGPGHEVAEVATAIAGHYSPLGPNDTCPTSPTSVAIALADKIDTLVGIWSIGEKPTGSRDPFALRRAALGIIRLITETRSRIPLSQIFRFSAEEYRTWVEPAVPGATGNIGEMPSPIVEQTVPELMAFIAERLKVHLRDKGVRHDLIDAVFAVKKPDGGQEDDLVRLRERVEALDTFLKSDDGANLLTAYRRAANIVRIEEKKDRTRYDGPINKDLFREQEENYLYASLLSGGIEIQKALDSDSYMVAMEFFANLRSPIDNFFDRVTVNAPEPVLRENRLKLLAQITTTMNQVADFSKLEGGER